MTLHPCRAAAEEGEDEEPRPLCIRTFHLKEQIMERAAHISDSELISYFWLLRSGVRPGAAISADASRVSI